MKIPPLALLALAAESALWGQPANVSVTPLNGTGTAATFQFTASHSGGYTQIDWIKLLINYADNGDGGCYLYYVRNGNVLYLARDTGYEWDGGVVGAGSTVENSQCRLDLAGSTATLSGNNITISAPLTFKPEFPGPQVVSMRTHAGAADTGFQTMGSWTTTPLNPPNQPPGGAVSPASGTGSEQTFAYTATSPYGYFYIPYEHIIITDHSPADYSHACYIYYNRAGSYVYLPDDDGNWSNFGTLGQSAPLENSQCKLDLSHTTASGSGNSWVLNLPFSFKPAWAGVKTNYYEVIDHSMRSTGWLTAGAWTMPGNAPVTNSVTPGSGSGRFQTFSFLYSDANGAATLNALWGAIGTVVQPSAGNCMFYYVQAANLLYLLADDGLAWLPPAVLGSAAVLENSQCALDAGASSKTLGQNNLTLNAALKLKPAYQGSKTIYMWASDTGGLDSGWQNKGSWTVPPDAPPAPPASGSAAPNNGSGFSASFSFQYSDPDGGSDLSNLWVAIGPGLAGPNNCFVYYSRADNLIHLMDDAGVNWTAFAPGSAGLRENSQCAVNPAGASISIAGNTAILNLPVIFKAGAASLAKNIYMYASDLAGLNTGWQTVGTWTVPASTPPLNLSVTPNSGSGSAQTFSFVFSDPNGYQDLKGAWMVFNGSWASNNACWIYYDRLAHTLLLMNDAGSGLLDPLTPGTSGIRENSQCALDAQGSSTAASGNNLTVTLALSFKGHFAGTQKIYMKARDGATSDTAPGEDKGSWTLANDPPSPVSVSPGTGLGLTQTFTLTFADGNGYRDLWSVNAIFAGYAVSVDSCFVHYERLTNELFLFENDGTQGAALTPTQAGTRQNSQCKLFAADSSVSAGGGTLTLVVKIEFKAAYRGYKNIFLEAWDNVVDVGPAIRGDWVVPPSTNEPPVNVSVMPSSGSGNAETFSLKYSDPNGSADLNSMQLYVTPSGPFTTVDACALRYVRPENTLYLFDDNLGWLPMTPGAAGTQRVSQCEVNGANVSIATSPTDITITLPVVFMALRPGYAGQKYLYMFSADMSNAQANGGIFQNKGSFEVVPTGDFILTLGAYSANLVSGGTCPISLAIAPMNGFAQFVNLTYWSTHPGLTAAFAQNPIQAATTMTISATSAVPAGAYSLTVSASGGNRTHSATVQVTVGTPPQISIYPTSVTVPLVGRTGSVTVTAPTSSSWIARSNDPSWITLTGNVNSDGTITGSGSPAGSTVGYSVAALSSGSRTGTISIGASLFTVSQTVMTLVSSLAELQSCIDSGGGSTVTVCQLVASTYTVTTPIRIAKSNVTVIGGGAARTDTKLVRGTDHVAPIVWIPPEQALQGVTIENLTFCGSNLLPRTPQPAPVCPTPFAETKCDQILAHQKAGIYVEGEEVCTDLKIEHAALSTSPPAPFAYSGPYSVTVSNCDFEDATGHAIVLLGNGDATRRVNDVYIRGSAINSSALTGIFAGADAANYADSRICDSKPDFPNSTEVFLPRNIRIEDNTFANNNTGAIGMNARWVGLRDNIFTNNYTNPQAALDGGSVFFDQCTDTVQIYHNTLTGPAYPNTGGLELWGRNIDVGADDPNQGNKISGYGLAGIGANSLYHANIINNETAGNGVALSTGGIAIWTANPGPCDSLPRDTDTITISRNTSTGQAYGVLVDQGTASTSTVKGLTIKADNVLLPNSLDAIRIHPWATLVGANFENQIPAVPPIDDYTPRSLGVALGTPTLSKCAPPGSRNQVFTFLGSDVLGASNIRTLQAIFSLKGPTVTDPGPDGGARGCHFLYDPPTNTLHLDGPNGGFNWTASSTVGTGGSDISNCLDSSTGNCYCTIHAGPPLSHVETDPLNARILRLTLAIDFGPAMLATEDKHVFVYTENKNDLNNGSGWTYWGWWKTP